MVDEKLIQRKMFDTQSLMSQLHDNFVPSMLFLSAKAHFDKEKNREKISCLFFQLDVLPDFNCSSISAGMQSL